MFSTSICVFTYTKYMYTHITHAYRWKYSCFCMPFLRNLPYNQFLKISYFTYFELDTFYMNCCDFCYKSNNTLKSNNRPTLKFSPLNSYVNSPLYV